MAKRTVYPSIPDPGTSIPTMLATLLALKQTVSLITVNAQTPRPDYDLTTGSQRFLTRENFSSTGTLLPETTNVLDAGHF